MGRGTQFSFDGRIALVTGGASGIGRAIAEGFAESGATVVILDRNAEAAAEVIDAQTARDRTVVFEKTDLRDATAIPAVVDRVLKKLGRIDFLVNAAGVIEYVELMDVTPEGWDMVMDINVKAAVFLTQAVAKHMIGRGDGGRIVNIASGYAVMPGPPVAYSCSKAALAHLSRVSARTLGPHDINVNTVAPGITRTPMVVNRVASAFNQTEGGVTSNNMLGRVSEPEDVAGMVLFLCAPESRQITAQLVYTGGGALG